jgi:hypothetical protein
MKKDFYCFFVLFLLVAVASASVQIGDQPNSGTWENDNTYDNQLENGNEFWGNVPPTP